MSTPIVAGPRLTSGACMALENRLACFVTSSCSSRDMSVNESYLVPIRIGVAVCKSATVQNQQQDLPC